MGAQCSTFDVRVILQAQARDPSSILRNLSVGKGASRIEVGEQMQRKAVTVAWEVGESSAGAAGGRDDGWSVKQHQIELDEMEKEYARRRDALSSMEKKLKEDEDFSAERERMKAGAGTPPRTLDGMNAACRVRGGDVAQVQHTKQLVQEMKDDILRRHKALMARCVSVKQLVQAIRGEILRTEKGPRSDTRACVPQRNSLCVFGSCVHKCRAFFSIL